MYSLPAPGAAEAPQDLWQALADPTRRALLDRLRDGPRSTSQLCEGLPMSRFGVMKHLGVLERAGLVIARRHGRLRLNHLNAAPLHGLSRRWLSPRAERIAAGVAELGDRAEDKRMETRGAEAAQVLEVALEWTITAPVQRVWRLFFEEPELWWPRGHRAGPEGAAMRLEAALGAELREERPGGGGLTWYRIIALDPLSSVDLTGSLASRYGGPATSLLHIAFAPGAEEGSTLLKLTDSLFGRIGPDLAGSLTSGWQSIIGEGLKPHAERAVR